MPIRIDLLSLEQNTPGYARLVIKKWQGTSEQLEFSIQRNQDAHFLQAGQQWSNNPFWFKVARFNLGADGESLETQVGPEVVDPLLIGSSSANYRLELRSQDGSRNDQGVVTRNDPNLLPSSASGTTRSSGGSAELNVRPEIPDLPELQLTLDPVPVIETPEPETTQPVAPSTMVPVVEKKKSSLLPLIVTLLMLLVFGAAAAWYWLGKSEVEPQASVPATNTTASNSEQSTTAAAPATPCSAENMNSLSELVFVQGCVKQAPNSAELLDVIAVAKAGKHCGIAQRLYANRSQAGDVEVARAYAREYDPKYHQASECFAEADAATAAYWYETILGYTPDDSEAQQRFEELKP